MQFTEKQIKAWLKIKIMGFHSHIGTQNAYGSEKKLKTLARDLRGISAQLESYIRNN